MKRSSVRPFVRLSHHSTTAAACGGFAAERRAGMRYRSTAAAAGCSAVTEGSVTLTADVVR